MPHTPGPWTLEEENTNSPHYADIMGDGEYIAAVERWDGSGPSAMRDAKANARLIAAAPEMLEALEYLTKEINLGKLNVRKDFSLMNAHACACKAITKAKGE